jgi:predicted RNA binding protein YcfA (HicA-like mRNA interferase family)
MNDALNYGELEAMLRQLGFQSVRSAGPQKVFENATFDALIVLPPSSAAEPVRPHHLATVRKLVIEKGITDTEVFDRLLDNHPLAKA